MHADDVEQRGEIIERESVVLEQREHAEIHDQR